MRNWPFPMNTPLLSIIMSTILDFFVRQYRPKYRKTHIPTDRPTDRHAGCQKERKASFFRIAYIYLCNLSINGPELLFSHYTITPDKKISQKIFDRIYWDKPKKRKI